MTLFAVLGSGPSMSQQIADAVKGKCRVVAVSDTYRLAPWADALVSHDRNWWDVHREALAFAGRKFCGWERSGTELLKFDVRLGTGLNSGLQGMRVAVMLGATRIALLGFDMHGSHFFGEHPKSLATTTPDRLREHLRQFSKWYGPAVVNCTPGSALTHFRMSTIEAELLEQQSAA
jgi:hypothetical protein